MSTMKRESKKSKKPSGKIACNASFPVLNPDAAGIDLGSKEHWVAVDPGRTDRPVRSFGTFTEDLEAMADWLKECAITSVAMEATGVYWIPTFQTLERRGFSVLLVNAARIKNVSGRKSDIMDCQWIQRLHACGLLNGSFRPADAYCVLRTYMRYREELIPARTVQIQHMQKTLLQMNLQLTQVVSDISGESGLAIIEAILEGQRDPVRLAALAHHRIKASRSQIAKALVGDWRPEHLFVLKKAFELFHVYESKITELDEQIALELEKLPNRVCCDVKPLPAKTPNKKIDEKLRLQLYTKIGADLTAIDGIGVNAALTMLTEVGADLSRFKSEKNFTSWLGLCPSNRISGGKILSGHTRRVVNRLSDVLRLAASSLERSQSALGAFYRRMKSKLGPAPAITACAHKLARLIYRLIKYGEAYVREGLADYEKKCEAQRRRQLERNAKALGFELTPIQSFPPAVS